MDNKLLMALPFYAPLEWSIPGAQKDYKTVGFCTNASQNAAELETNEQQSLFISYTWLPGQVIIWDASGASASSWLKEISEAKRGSPHEGSATTSPPWTTSATTAGNWWHEEDCGLDSASFGQL